MTSLLDKLVSGSKEMVAVVASHLLEEMIFPWYEARTGKYNSDRSMRSLVAERIEQDLSNVLWVSKLQALEWDEDEDPHDATLFVVQHIFSQGVEPGVYDLMVTVYQKTYISKVTTIPLQQFLRDFYPYKELTFADCDD